MFVLGCSFCGIGYLTLATSWPHGGSGQAEFPAVQNAMAQAALLVLTMSSLVIFASRTATTLRAWLAVKVLALLMFTGSTRHVGGQEAAGFAPLILEIALYEAFFLNLLFCLISILLALLVRLLSPASSEAGAALASPLGAVLPYLGIFLSLLVLAVIACLLVYYREACIDRNQRIKQLEGAVEKLTQTNLGYQNYASEASFRSQREERLRITRELHDVIGYTFTNNIMMMEAAVAKIHNDPERVRKLIDLARENAKSGLEKIRHSLYVLRAQEGPRTPMANKIVQLLTVFQAATKIDVRYDFANLPNEIDEERESALYYFVQEAVTNAFRHGAPSIIKVAFLCSDRGLVATVSDNGRGAGPLQEGIGISGMRERIGRLNGSVRILDIGNGFEIAAEVPHPQGRVDERQ